MSILTPWTSWLPGLNVTEPTDIEGWRIGFIRLLLILGTVFLPIGIAVSIPVYLADQNYSLMIVDVIAWLACAGRLFSKANTYKFDAYVVFAILYLLMTCIFIELGPTYARSACL